MPNWIKNNLKIKNNGEKVMEVLSLLKDDNGDMTFETLMPTPEELLTEPSPQRDKEKAKKFTEKYGADDWYNWRCKNWGCKWDASESGFWKDGDEWVVSFETPWSPPCEFVEALSKKFPDMEFVIQFADESQVCTPIGQCTYVNGDETFINMDEDLSFGQAVWHEEWVTNLKGE